MTFLLSVTTLEMSTSMEMNSSIRTELHTIETLQGEKGVDLKIEIDPVHLMQGAIQLVLMKMNQRSEQETKVTTKIKVQKETKDPQPKADTNQRRRKDYLVKFAKKQHTQIYSVVQNSRPTYKVRAVDQRASPKRYASIAWEPSLVTADTVV